MKLALKFTLCFLAGMIAVRGYSTYLQVQRETDLFEESSLHDHEVAGRDLAAAVATIWQNLGEDFARRYVEEANARKVEQTIRWVWPGAAPGSPDAPVLPPQDPSALEVGAPLSRFIRDGRDRQLITYIPVKTADQRLGAIEMAQSLEDGYRYVRTSMLRTLITTSVIVVLSGMMALVLGFVFVGRPVQRLITTARRVAAGDFSSRIELRRRSDELAELATEVNAMCAKLAEADRRIAAETSAHQTTAEQLRHADRLTTVGRLASGLAHELGTPLNVVLARARMIVAREVEGNQITECARIVIEQSERMSKIIRQLLDFARRRSPRRVAINLDQIARQMVSLLAPVAREHEVTVKFVTSESPEASMVRVDPDQIQQVLSNLILNGMQAMPSGGNLTVGVRRSTAMNDPGSRSGVYEGDGDGRTPRQTICLYVQDEGVGIPEQDLPNVFEPFFTTKGLSHGTGLGLSIAAGIVREHDGWIDIDSRVGSGSCFSVHFPEESNACAGVC